MTSVCHQKGFTLLELVVVIILLGILSAVAATRWSATDATAGYQADLLARNIRHMQMLAMTWGQSLRLSLVSTTGYSASCVSGSATAPCNGTNPITDPVTGDPFSVVLSNNVTISGATLDVDSLGRPKSAGVLLTASQAFTLTAGAQTWSVTVQPVTGFVSVATP